MVAFKLEFGVELLGTAAQIRVTDTAETPDVTYDITIPAGIYFFSVDTTTKNDIIQTIDALIDTACGARAWAALNADGRRINWDNKAAQYTLRLLTCDDAEPLAMLLGLYGDSYDWDYYQTHDAPATWRVPGNVCWFNSGYSHPQRDAGGFPSWNGEHRVAEDGTAVHLPRSRKDVLNLTFGTVPGTIMRAMSTDDGAYGTGATDSVSLWRAYNPDLNAPLVHIYAASRFNDFFYLQKLLTPENVRMFIDKWTGLFLVDLDLAVADV